MGKDSSRAMRAILPSLGAGGIFFVVYLILDVSSIFLVTGDLEASPLTSLMIGMDRFVADLLGASISGGSGMLRGAIFWSCIVAAMVFVYKLIKKTGQSGSDKI